MRCLLRFLRSISTVFLVTSSLFLSDAQHLQAQGGAVDPVFGSVSLGLYGKVLALAMQPDGKLLVAGYFTNSVVRLNSDGSVDQSFNPGSGAFTPLGAQVTAVALQSDSKIILGGFFSSFNGSTHNSLVRLNSDGSVDESFDAAGSFGYNQSAEAPDMTVDCIAVQIDGHVLVGSNVEDEYAKVSIVRLNPDGNQDDTFNAISGTGSTINNFAVQADNDILVGGFFTDLAQVPRNGIARFKADGTVDAAFDPGSALDRHVTDGSGIRVAALNTGKIIIVGGFTAYNGTSRNGIARLNPDGSLDSTFSPGSGVDYPGSIYAFSVEPDGKLILAGNFGYTEGVYHPCLVQLTADGKVDPSFDPGTGPNSAVEALAVGEDGTVFASGFFTSVNGFGLNGLAHFNLDGTVDKNYLADLASGPNSTVYGIALQPDGRMIVGGSFSAVGVVTANGVARLKTDGTLDPSFNFNPPPSNRCYIRSLLLQSDGKVIIGGSFDLASGADYYNCIARLNSDGSLDTTYVAGTIPTGGAGLGSSQVEAMASAPDGKIIVGGMFLEDGAPCFARLNSDGSLDQSFNPGTNNAEEIVAVAVQPDSKVLVAGDFNVIQGVLHSIFARLNADGSLDTGFVGSVAGGGVSSFAVLNSGQIMIGGSFTSVDGVPRQYIARLNADGTLDASFDPGNALQSPANFSLTKQGVLTITVDTADRLVVGGNFVQSNGTTSNIARLNADGSLDPFFLAGGGANGEVDAFALQSDGKILVTGDFGQINGVLRNYVARLTGNGQPDFFYGQVNVGGGFYYLQFPNSNPFGYYNLAGNGYAFPYFYHADLGMEYFFDAQDGQGGAYMYDFASNDFFYTSPVFPFPYLYDFNLNTVLYYYPDTTNPGHYTSNPRYFFNFGTGQIITK